MTELKEFDGTDRERNAELFDAIKDCFVTGQWEGDKDAKRLLEQDDDDAFGDFEDLEGADGQDMDGFGGGNGVQHTKKVNSTQKI